MDTHTKISQHYNEKFLPSVGVWIRQVKGPCIQPDTHLSTDVITRVLIEILSNLL